MLMHCPFFLGAKPRIFWFTWRLRASECILNFQKPSKYHFCFLSLKTAAWKTVQRDASLSHYVIRPCVQAGVRMWCFPSGSYARGLVFSVPVLNGWYLQEMGPSKRQWAPCDSSSYEWMVPFSSATFFCSWRALTRMVRVVESSSHQNCEPDN